MNSSRRLKRWTALLLLAAAAFTQASLALAGCEMERRALARVVAEASAERGDCDMHSFDRRPLGTNRCLAHCTSDLQIAGQAAAIVRGASESVVLYLPRITLQPANRPERDTPPPDAVPIRILLHAFLV